MAVDNPTNPEGTINSCPAPAVKPITLHDTNEFTMDDGLKGSTQYPRAFIMDTDGIVALRGLNDVDVLVTVLAGLIYPICVKRFLVTGTTSLTGVALS